MAGQDLTTLLGLNICMYVLGARRHVSSGLHPSQCGMRVVAHVAMGTLQTSGLSLVALYAGIRERSEAPFSLSAPPSY